MMDLNRLVVEQLPLVEEFVDRGSVQRLEMECGATIYDFGIDAPGGVDAGLLLSRLILANLASVTLEARSAAVMDVPSIVVVTDQPLEACMASQYAGWPISGESFFAMGSGPMRTSRGKEKLLERYEMIQPSATVVGSLETDQFPSDEVVEVIAHECDVSASSVILLVAPVTSIAGSIQVVARSIETAMHKLDELEFDLNCIRSGVGSAPLATIATKMMEGIGRTNDAILYGAEVTFWVDCDPVEIQSVGPRTPSCSSKAFGAPFAEIFEAHDKDFYKIDPLLFSPAVVRFVNLRSGEINVFGQTRPDLLRRSFGLESKAD